MSQAYPELPHDWKTFVAYVHLLAQSKYVKEIYLIGSRNPRNYKLPAPDTDWDISVITTVNLYLPSPRANGYLNCDLGLLRDDKQSPGQRGNRTRCMLYPVDELGLLEKEENLHIHQVSRT